MRASSGALSPRWNDCSHIEITIERTPSGVLLGILWQEGSRIESCVVEEFGEGELPEAVMLSIEELEKMESAAMKGGAA